MTKKVKGDYSIKDSYINDFEKNKVQKRRKSLSKIKKEAQKKVNNFQPLVQIETTNHCNANCITCPHDKLTREKTTMDFDLFRNIIDQCINEEIGKVELSYLGEPLLDKDIFRKISYASQNDIDTFLISNFSLLSLNKIDKLLDSGLKRINVSIDGFDKRSFENVRKGLDYNTVVNNLENLIKRKNELNRQFPIIKLNFVAIDYEREKVKRLREKWENKVDILHIIKPMNWGGKHEILDGKDSQDRIAPCPLPFSKVTILSNGKVALCSRDYDGEVILGDLNEETLRAVWFGEKYINVRKKHLNRKFKKLDLCPSCDYQGEWD